MASDPQDERATTGVSDTQRRKLICASLIILGVAVAIGVAAVRFRSEPAQTVAAFSDDPLVTCGGVGMPFRASRLRGPIVGDTTDTSSDRKLITKLHEVGRMPEVSTGDARWRLVRESASQAQFIGRQGSAYTEVLLERHDNVWRLESSGGCATMSVAQPGLSVADIVLDTRRSITPQTTELHLFVQGIDCNDGVNTSKSKIAGPEVHVEANRIVVTTAVRTTSGFHDCSGAIRTVDGDSIRPLGSEVVVQLDAPIGDRTVLDGTRFPYEPVTTWGG